MCYNILGCKIDGSKWKKFSCVLDTHRGTIPGGAIFFFFDTINGHFFCIIYLKTVLRVKHIMISKLFFFYKLAWILISVDIINIYMQITLFDVSDFLEAVFHQKKK